MKNSAVVLKTFWIVVADRVELKATYRHESLDLARLEAERLARLNTGVQFYVFALVGAAVIVDPVQWRSADDLPF